MQCGLKVHEIREIIYNYSTISEKNLERLNYMARKQFIKKDTLFIYLLLIELIFLVFFSYLFL